MRLFGITALLCIASFLPSFAQTTWTVTSTELLFTDPPFQQCHASTIVETAPGKLLAAWFGGSHEGAKDVAIWTSRQTNQSWSKPIAVANGKMNDTLQYPCWNPVLFKDKRNLLHLYYKVGPNPREWWGMEMTSSNQGQTWSAPKRLPAGILGPIKNKPVQLADGAILSPSSTETDARWQAHMERSTDGGLHWQNIPIDTAGSFDVIQPSVLQYRDGRLQVLCRSRQGNVMQAWSSDKGKTWSKLSPTALINPNSGTDALTLKDGSQLIVYNPDVPGKEWWQGRSVLQVALSKDGLQWKDVAVLENHPKQEFSYPAIVQTQDGKVHITYTYDRKNVKHVVLEKQPGFALIPYPASLQAGKGTLTITPATTLYAEPGFEASISALQGWMQKAFGKPLPKAGTVGAARIVLQKEGSITAPEGYRLVINKEKMILAAGTPAGMFRALQTIRQLLPASMERKKNMVSFLSLPALTINDEPAYAWRGLHLDVARHFFSIEYLHKLIDRMALYKMNKLHLHLTDDQGWRIEIKKYPVLTEQGAWRTFDRNDSACMKQSKENPDMAIDPEHIIQRDGKTLYGGYYTQEQLKELVQYAADRYVDIIPEIDMPGHMMTAIHAYPDLSCEGGSQWGELFSTPICPCKESTYEFAENIFTEVMNLFPAEYIHLGADEVDRKPWAASPLCTALMEKEGLKNTAELQSYFVRRMEKFFQSKGRKLIGWDEILEGGISATANVMYWRSWVPNAPIHAAQNGNHVIMSPGNPLYFDNLPDANSLSNIYRFSVVPEKLTAEQGSFIIGAQANLWSEKVPSEKRADYLYFPRMMALAERVWSKQLNYTAFESRLPAHYDRLEQLGVNYRLPDLSGFTEQNVFVDKAVLAITPPIPGLTIHYTTDGSLPTKSSPALVKPLTITQPVTIKLAAFTAAGSRGEIYTLQYKQETYLRPASTVPTSAGLQCAYYKKYFRHTGEMKPLTADSQFVTPNVTVPTSVNAPSFGLQYRGHIEVPETGVYSFYLLCDDGGILKIGDREVVNNDGQHGPVERSGQVALQKGWHPFVVDFIEAGGGFSLGLKYSLNNGPLLKVPDSFFRH